MRFRIFLSLGLSVLVLAGALLLQAELTQSASAESQNAGKADSQRKENLLALRIGGTHEHLSKALTGGKPAKKKMKKEKIATKKPPEAKPRKDKKPQPLYVRLKKGESVSVLCRREFGRAGPKMVKSVLKLNGWTEAKARKLQAGDWVRLR